MQLPVYVINLDRRPDRWQTISDHLTGIGISPTRIPAIDALVLAEQEQRRAERGDQPQWKINLGSAAGMLGHSTAMGSLLDSGAPAALILEDDAELAPDTLPLLHSIDWWPSGAKVVRLEAVYPIGGKWSEAPPLWRATGKTPNNRDLRRLERWTAGSAAYLINREGCELVLAAFRDPIHTVDHTLFDLRVSRIARRLKTHQVVPAMARQRVLHDSDQVAWRERKEAGTKPLLRRWRRLRRNSSAFPYKLRLRLLMLLRLVQKEKIVCRL